MKINAEFVLFTWSCSPALPVVKYLYLYQISICIDIVLFSVVVSNSSTLPSMRYLYLYQVCIWIRIKIVFVSTLCCFLLLYRIPPPFLWWGMTWGGAEALFVRLVAASDSEYFTLFDINKMYLNIYQNGANHYFGLIDLLANVKRGTIISHFWSCMVLLISEKECSPAQHVLNTE